jgi:nitrite reductase/ring-hydroxylating ferredoxin subunit
MGVLIKVAAFKDVPPGTCRQVDAGGQAVAVCNVGGTLYAIGGTCTHRGGPLGEGELDETVITCPWHGAQFDVTTGQVVGPPAGQSVPAYNVVVDGEDIKVDV